MTSSSESHPNMSVAHSCLQSVSPFCFWSLANKFPDLSISCSDEAYGHI